MDLLIFPPAVRIVTTRTRPPWSGCNSTTLLSTHFKGGRFLSFMVIKSFSCKLFCSVFHLERPWRVLRYSAAHRFQKSCVIFLINCQRLNRLIGISIKSTSGRLVKDSPTKKCAGANGYKSSESEDIADKGLEFRQASTWAKAVDNSSNVNSVFPIIRLRWYLDDLTPASHNPPMWEEPEGMNLH